MAVAVTFNRAALITRCLRLRPDPTSDRVLYAAKLALRSAARRITALTTEIDEITEEVERLPLEETVDTVMGEFEKGTQGAFFLKVIGWSGGRRYRTTGYVLAHAMGAIAVIATARQFASMEVTIASREGSIAR